MVNSKHIFWQAFIVSLAIFALGFVVGFFFESSRADSVQLNLLNSEIDVLDYQLRQNVLDDFGVGCEAAVESTFSFADQIYEESLRLENLDSAAKVTNTLSVLHRRYDLLRMLLWQNSLELRKDCQDFHILVYVYNYSDTSVSGKAEQGAFSRLALDVKNKYPDEILLIPLDGNADLQSVKLVMDKFDVERLPIMIVDEERVVNELVDLSDLENIIFESNKP